MNADGRANRPRYGNSRSPVSASSTKIALTGQFSAASRTSASEFPIGSTTSDWRSSFNRNVFPANDSHMALPTQAWWSTQTFSLRATAILLMQRDRKRLQRPELDAGLIRQIPGLRLQIREPLG